MTPGILQWVSSVVPLVNAHGDIIELGAYDVNGNPRHLFPEAKSYLGVDQAAGRNVDLVTPVRDVLSVVAPQSADLVICCEMLEHDPTPFKTVEIVKQLLRPGGHFLATSPGNGFPEHRYPKDYWRLMPDAWRDLVFEGFELLKLDTVPGPIMCALGKWPASS